MDVETRGEQNGGKTHAAKKHQRAPQPYGFANCAQPQNPDGRPAEERQPFDLPERVRAAAAEGAKSVWAPSELGDVPICFLANGDTTGGNSGSAVVNGKGELVGLNFDRVWENIAGDFGYNPPLSRNIIVDFRYPLFLMDRVDGADHLLAELGLASLRGQMAPARSEPPPRPPAKNAVGCSAGGDDDAAPSWILAGLLAFLWRRRSVRGSTHM